MARKKKTAKKAIAPVGDSSVAIPVDIQGIFNDMLEQGENRVRGVSNSLTVSAGQFMFQGNELGDELDVVVLDFRYLNRWYDGVYDSDNPSSPDCYAVSMFEKDLIPAPNAMAAQADSCEVCELNQWGSADRGKGKACSNRRLVAMVHANDLDGDPNEVEIVTLNIPSTSIRAFDKFYSEVRNVLKRPTIGVIVRMTLEPEGTYSLIHFTVEGLINDKETVQMLAEKVSLSQDILEAGYEPTAQVEEKPKAKRKTRAKKKVSSAKAKTGSRKKGRSKFSS